MHSVLYLNRYPRISPMYVAPRDGSSFSILRLCSPATRVDGWVQFPMRTAV